MLTLRGFMKAVAERSPAPAEKKTRGRSLPGRAVAALCLVCFMLGFLFTSRVGVLPSSSSERANSSSIRTSHVYPECDQHKRRLGEGIQEDIMGEVSRTHQAIQSLEKSISSLEMELAVARTSKNGGQAFHRGSSPGSSNRGLKKAFAVIGINTAFSSKRRRDSVRETWMPKGSKLSKLEKEKGVVLRFVIGHSATPGGVLDRAIDAEDAETKDFLRLEHVEGYHELSMKTRVFFATAISIWDADFYVKVDDDVHVNLGMLVTTLARYKTKPRTYIGCMKSGPVQ